MSTKHLAVLVAVASLAGCSPRPSQAPPSLKEWRRGLERLEALRKVAGRPRTERLTIEISEPHTGKILTARGAAAIAPPRSLRMLLVGPGGTTALDVWIHGERYRFAIPAIELIKRGSTAAPRSERRGLPVDFLGYWLLHPAAGDLLWYTREPRGERFVLRDGDAIVDLSAREDGSVEARRTTWAKTGRIEDETVTAERMGCGKVRYHQGSIGLDVTVTCEGDAFVAPPSRAFVDPDAEEDAP